MSKKKKALMVLICLFMVILNIIILTHRSPLQGDIKVSMTVEGDEEGTVQIFASETGAFSTNLGAKYENVNEKQNFSFDIDIQTKYLRYVI